MLFLRGLLLVDGWYHTVKILNVRTPKKFAVITQKFEQDGFTVRVMHLKDAAGIANSVDPDQTAPLGAVWSGSALLAQTCLSKNLGSLRYLPLNFGRVILICCAWCPIEGALAKSFHPDQNAGFQLPSCEKVGQKQAQKLEKVGQN